jgi:hypothetical protein
VRWELVARRRANQGIGIPVAVGIGSDSVWVLQANGVVLRVDLATSKVRARIGTASGATAIAVSRDAVWVINGLRGTLTRIDRSTNRADFTGRSQREAIIGRRGRGFRVGSPRRLLITSNRASGVPFEI